MDSPSIEACSHDRPSTSGHSSTVVRLLSPLSHISNSSSSIVETSQNVAADSSRMFTASQIERPAHRDFVCGLLAAVVETTITYPLNKLIFRQQLLGITASQSMAQLRHEGIRFVYRGLLFPLLQKSASRSLMFGMYDEYRKLIGCRYAGRSDGDATRRHSFTRCHASAAFLAGMTEAFGLTPFERVQILMQNSKYHVAFKNSYDALRSGILRPYGLREYYRGLSMIILRNGSSNILFFAFRNPLKDLILHGDRISVKEFSANRHLMADFGSGAVLGASISTAFYPLNVIKARMQSRLGGEFQKPHQVLYKILKEREFSIRGLYRGVTLNFSRSLLTWGLTNAGYEFFQRHLFGKGASAPVQHPDVRH